MAMGSVSDDVQLDENSWSHCERAGTKCDTERLKGWA